MKRDSGICQNKNSISDGLVCFGGCDIRRQHFMDYISRFGPRTPYGTLVSATIISHLIKWGDERLRLPREQLNCLLGGVGGACSF